MEHVIISPVLVVRMRVQHWDVDAILEDGSCLYVDVCGICGGPGAIYECGCEGVVEGYYDCDFNVWMNVVFVLVTTLLVQGVLIHQHATTIPVRQFGCN